MQPKAPLPGIGDAALKSGNAENVKRISGQILAAADIDQILLDLRHEILGCFDAEDLTLFVVDSEKKEIFSKIPHLDTVQEVRTPITEQSLAGFCAKYLRPVNVGDAYSLVELSAIHPALAHDSTDRKSVV